MSKRIKVSLSKEGIKELISELKEYKKQVHLKSEEINQDLINLAEKEISNNISSDALTDKSELIVKKTKKTVSMVGEQAIYDEFGTGTLGERNPHENKTLVLKTDFAMKGYNTGKTIRQNDGSANDKGISEGELYWTYKDKNGVVHYTTGRPAGMQVYKASKTVRKQMQSIIKEKLGGIK